MNDFFGMFYTELTSSSELALLVGSSSVVSVLSKAIRKAFLSLDVEFWLNIPAWIT